MLLKVIFDKIKLSAKIIYNFKYQKFHIKITYNLIIIWFCDYIIISNKIQKMNQKNLKTNN